jgi:hypothetical protein
VFELEINGVNSIHVVETYDRTAASLFQCNQMASFSIACEITANKVLKKIVIYFPTWLCRTKRRYILNQKRNLVPRTHECAHSAWCIFTHCRNTFFKYYYRSYRKLKLFQKMFA